MGTSVPGNSCRTTTRCCAPSTGAGCLLNLPSQCVYYAGSNISGPGINTGDTMTVVVNKLSAYISTIIPAELTANNGLSVSSGTVVLGQTVDAAGDPGILLSNREIPTDGFNVFLSGGGSLVVGSTADNGDLLQVAGTASLLSGNLRYTNEGFGGAPVMRTNSFLTMFNTSNLIIEQGVGTALTSYPELRFTGLNNTVTLNYCGILNGFNFNAGSTINQPFLITTSGDSSAVNLTSGDIILRPGTRAQIGNPTTQDGSHSILLQPCGSGDVTITNGAGNAKLGIGQTPTAKLHIAAGTTVAGTAPIKLTAGVNLSVIENGTFEYDGTNLYFSTGGVRRTVTLV